MDGGDSKREVAQALGEDSARLLKAVDELRALEERKRREKVSGREFRELAEQVEAKAREVFSIAGQETDDAHAASRVSAVDGSDTAAPSIEEVAAGRDANE
jgi:DNA-binding transcriptional ArsR family regulator